MGLVAFDRRGELGDLSYFLSGSSSFFHRFADSGFRNKWTGLWSGERKFLEYFALKAGDEWLSPSTCSRLEYDMAKAVHHYDLDCGKAAETVFLADGPALIIELLLEKPMRLELEVAFNIRNRFENENKRKYYLTEGRGGLAVGNELGFISLNNISGKMAFCRDMAYREHFPSGEKQSCFIPGKIYLNGKRIALSLSVNKKYGIKGSYRDLLGKKERGYSRLVNGRIKSDNRSLANGFSSSILAIELLKKRQDGFYCYYAGLPWFQQFWGRDVFWVLPSLTCLGYFDEARQCLRLFAEEGRGRIPNLISRNEGNLFNSIDATLLWIKSMDDYVMSSGDMAFLKSMGSGMSSLSRAVLGMDTDRDGFAEHDACQCETWMDTIRRGPRAVDVQALYFGALNSAARMLALLGQKGLSAEAGEKAASLEKKFDSGFYSSGFYSDVLTDSGRVKTRTANALVPLLFGLGRHSREILRCIESGAFTTPVGVRTRAEGEDGFSPSGYHSGMAWSLTTAWASAAEFAAGRAEQGWGYMKILLDDANRDALGCIGECWDSRQHVQKGCGLQLWGSGFVPRLVDEFMLGLRINAMEKTIEASPALPRCVGMIERKRRIGGKEVSIRFEKRQGKVRAECSDKSFALVLH